MVKQLTCIILISRYHLTFIHCPNNSDTFLLTISAPHPSLIHYILSATQQLSGTNASMLSHVSLFVQPMDCSPPGSSVENNKSYSCSLKGHSPVWKEDSLTEIIGKGEKCFIRGELRMPKKHEDGHLTLPPDTRKRTLVSTKSLFVS